MGKRLNIISCPVFKTALIHKDHVTQFQTHLCHSLYIIGYMWFPQSDAEIVDGSNKK